MSLRHVIATYAAEPWAILPEKLQRIAAFAEIRAQRQLTPEEIRAAIGEEPRTAAASVARGIAVLPIYGTLLSRASSLDESSGVVSTARLSRQFDALMNDDQVSAIVLDLDTPGGTAGGIEEFSQKVFKARGVKPVTAVANSLAASAGYWIAAAAEEFVVSPSSEVGSIGCFMVHCEITKWAEQEGYRFTLLRAGKYKAEGNPWEELTPEAAEALQARVNEVGTQFMRAVAKYRNVALTDVRNGFGQGRVVGAAEAVKLGMADRVATIEDVLAKLGGRRAVARGPKAEAGSDTRIAALAPAVGIINLGMGSGFVESLTAALSPAFTIIDSSPASDPWDGAPSAAPVPTPAPVAKEQAMSFDPAAPTNGADTTAAAVTAATQAANQRHAAILGLAKTARKDVAWIEAAVASGKAVDALRAELFTELQDRLNAGPTLAAPAAQVDVPNEAKKPFATAGEQLVAIVRAGTPGGHRDVRLNFINQQAIQAAASGMNESIGSEGGFFLQPTLLPGVLEPVYTEDPLLSRVTRIPITGAGLKYNVVDETSRATGSRYGGLQMYWVAEADTALQKKPKLRQMELSPKKIMGIGYLTDELQEDAAAAEVLLVNAFQNELRFMLTDAIFRGSGAGMPKGFLNSGAKVEQAIEGSQTIANTNASIATNLSKMLSRIPESMWGDVIFLYQQELLPSLVTAVIGSSTVPIFTQPGGLKDAPAGALLGRPAFPSEFCEAVGTPGDIIALVPSQYYLGDTGAAKSSTSVHVRFLYDEGTMKITYRVDGHLTWTVAVTPFKGALTRSPVVTLAVRS